MEVTDYELNVAPINEWITRQGVTGRERLALRACSSASWLDRVRRTRTLPNGEKLAALADAIGVKLDDLVIRKPKKRRN